MVTRNQRNQSGSQGGEQSQPQEDASMIDEFITKLADALQRRGKRRWKTKEASKAVEQAITALPKSTLKDSLQATLSEASAKLLQQLQPQEEAKKKPVKRAKPAADTQQKKKKKQSSAAVPLEPTLLDSTLETATAAILGGKTPKEFTSVAIAPLISRFPPPEGLIEWHLLRTQPAAASGEDWAAEINAAEKALQICNALATQAPSSEHALSIFEPALAQMLKAVEALEAASNNAGVEEEELGASGSKDIASGWEQLKLLSNRAVMCMNLAAKEISTINRADVDDKGAEAERNTRWWLYPDQANDVVNTARIVCSVAVSLCTVARLRTLKGDDVIDALAANAAHDMKILAPYAAIGQVLAAAEAVLDEVNKTDDDAMLFLALYMAAVENSGDISGEYYFLRMLAARNASAAATSLGDAAAAAARLLSSAASAPPPPEAVEWLRDQPPSSVIVQALESLQRGPQGLSAHLIYDASERAVKALAAAAKAGGVLAVGSSGGGANGDGGEGAATPADDLLFLISKEGDGGAFGRQDWGSKDDDEEDEGSDDEDDGLVIDDLPDEGKSMSEEEEEYSEEE